MKRHEAKALEHHINMRAQYYERMKGGLPVLKNDPQELATFGREAISHFSAAVVGLSDHAEALKDLRYVNMFAKAHYRLAAGMRESEQIQLPDQTIEVPNLPINSYLAFPYWLPFFRIAHILRDKTGIDDLLAAANILFPKQPRNEQHDLSFDFFAALSIGEVAKAQIPLEKLINYKPESSSSHAFQLLALPEWKAWKAVLDGDAAKASALLQEALALHQRWWTEGDKIKFTAGWVSLPLLQVAAYAHDHDMTITVESDYLPRWLYTGEGIK